MFPVRYIPRPVVTPPTEWYIVDYGDDLLGLKAGDGVARGVPEGSKAQWLELIDSIRAGTEDALFCRRLAYDPHLGIYSPRNTNDESEYFNTVDADLITRLLTNAQPYGERDIM
jgi:hypothetical protein